MHHLLGKHGCWFIEKIKSKKNIFQLFVLFIVVFLLYSGSTTLHKNLESRGIASGVDFLSERSGFNIIMHFIAYSEKSTYFDAFLVGVLNTLFVSILSIGFATVLGFVFGMARVSTNWLWSKIALIYIETIRNIPLLIQLFFWYFVVLRSAPYPAQSLKIADLVFLCNRGLYLPKPHFDMSQMGLLGIAIGLLFLVFLLFFKIRFRIGSKTNMLFKFLVFVILCATLLTNLTWDVPVLGNFNFEKGFVLIPEFLALMIGLSVYTSVFIAEIIRMGILSIPKGQTEAGLSLGLSRSQNLKLIIMPQAVKVIIPPLTNQYLNLTKNSSLAAAIGYPDLVSVFAGTVLNQTGQAVEIIAITMGVYLFISLVISGFMTIREKRMGWNK